MRILVPTDFSPTAKVAVRYVVELARKFNAEIKLLHVVSVNSPPRVQVAFRERHLIDIMTNDALEKLGILKDDIKALNPEAGEVTAEVIEGYPFENVVSNYAHYHDINLIALGTTGAGALEGMLIGSNAAALISKSAVPVLTIPDSALFRGIRNIVYAADMESVQSEINVLIPLIKELHPTIHILHITGSGEPVKEMEPLETDKYPDITIRTHMSNNNDLLEGLEEYSHSVNAEMLVMFTHELNFFEKLFGSSATRKMAFHTHTPLLTIKK
jgi:nucleotide-binding universal stress UspA family protein